MQPKIWLCSSEHAGDLNNGLAIAKALSTNIRIIHTGAMGAGAFEMSKEEDTIIVRFTNESLGESTYETVHRNDFPDVFINSANHSFHQHLQGIRTDRIKYFGYLPEFKNTLFVHVNIPNGPIESHPQTHMEVVFRQQIKTADQIQPNMHIYDTVPTRVNSQTLEAGKKEWKDELSAFEQNRPIYYVIMGERLDDNKDFSLQDAMGLAANVEKAVKKTGGSVVLTTSPRTKHDKEVIAAFTGMLDPHIPFYCYDYHANAAQNNPHLGLLALADNIIFTDDSMSMASDCIVTGRPVYVYERLPMHSRILLDKNKQGHDAYKQNLLEKGFVLPMDQLANPVRATGQEPVNSARQIAEDIRAQLALRKQQKLAPSLVNATGKHGFLSGIIKKAAGHIQRL